MSIFETALTYVRKLARPAPPPRRTTDDDSQQRPMRRRSRIKRAVKTAHARIVGHRKQPPPTGESR